MPIMLYGEKRMINGVVDSNWKALLDTILGKLLIPYELIVTNDEIMIKATPENAQRIQAHLQTALHSADSFFKQLPYSIHLSATNQQSSELPNQAPATPVDSVDSGTQVFKSFFGAGRFDEIALNIDALFSEKSGAISRDQVLYSKPAKSKHTAQIWHDFLNALLAEFNEIEAEQLRAIWLDPNLHLPTKEDKLDSTEQRSYRGLIQQCFGIIEDKEKNQVQIYFNYGLLHRLIFSPQIALLPQVDSTELHINKKHLLNYVQQLTQHGMLLRVYKSNEQDKSMLARPLFFGQEKLKIMPNHYTIIIDRSGSMEKHLDKLGNQVTEFIEKMVPYDPHAKIRIVFFNDKTGPVKEFSIAEGWNIRDFIKSAKHGGNTRLFGTIEEEVQYLYQQNLPEIQNTAIVFFTDGQDTVSNSRQQSIDQIIAILNAQHQQGKRLPKIFTMGIGAYDHEALHLFSQKTNSPFIHLKDTADFSLIYRYLGTLHYQQEVVEFLVRTSQTQAFTVPITLDGNIQSPNLIIPFQEREQVAVKVRGQQLWVKVMDATQVPLQMPYDQLQEKYEALYQIVTEKISPHEKIERLVQLANELVTQDAVVFSDISKEINYYTEQLQSTVNQPHSALHESLISRAQLALGYNAKAIEPHEASELLADWPAERPDPVLPSPTTSVWQISNPLSAVYHAIGSWFTSQTTELTKSVITERLQQNSQSPSGHRVDATCYLQLPVENEVGPSLSCIAPEFTARVYLKQPELDTTVASGMPTSDHYDLAKCQPIEYAGLPSLACEGERTNAIITPHLPERPLANLHSNLLLLQYGLHFFRKFFCTDSDHKSSKKVHTQDELQRDEEEVRGTLQTLQRMLERTREQLRKVKSLTKLYKEDADAFQNDLEKQQRQLNKGTLTKKAFEELQKDIQYFSENALPDCTAGLQNIVDKQQSPLVPLYSQHCQADTPTTAQLTCVSDNTAAKTTKLLK